MTIELAVAFPVLIAVAVIAVNALSFFGECSVFDRVAHESIRVHAVSPPYGQGKSQVCALVEQDVNGAMASSNTSVSVQMSSAGLGMDRYVATLEYSPNLFGMGLRSSVFGVNLPKLTHSTVLVVDAYKPGVIV
jgi:hypothetical protein